MLIEQAAATRLVWVAVVESASSAQTRVVAEPAATRGFHRARAASRQVVLRPAVALPLRIGLERAAAVFPGPIGSEGGMVALRARFVSTLTGLAQAATVAEWQGQKYRRYKG